MYDKHFVGLDLTGFEDGGLQRPVSRVTLLLDDKSVITAGDDTGLELSADCPHATQEMANDILARVRGYQYRMFAADAANLDPAAELGDGVTAGSVYSVLSRITEDGSGYASVAAPGEAELEDEYPAAGPMTQTFNRQIAKTRSQIIKTAEEITQLVTNEVDGLEGKLSLTSENLTAEINNTRNGLNSKLEQTASSLTSQINNTKDDLSSKIEQTASSLTSQITAANNQVSTISQTVNSIKTRVTGLEGNYTSLEQYVDSMTLSVSNGSTSSTISLKAGSTTIASKTIKMTGLVTLTGLSGGTTTINGACIKTGTIDAERLNLTGKITFSDLNTSTQTKINDAATDANSAKNTVQGWCYPNTTEIDGTKIRTGTVEASILRGGEVQLLNEKSIKVGTLEIVREYIPEGSCFRGAVSIKADSLILESENPTVGLIRIIWGSNSLAFLRNRMDLYGNFSVDGDATVLGDMSVKGPLIPFSKPGYIGTSIQYWTDIYLQNDPIVVSDHNKKADISDTLTAYDAFFDALRPTSYRLIDGQSGRTHLGLIAQDVEQALKDCGLTSMDFAGFIKSPRLDDKGQTLEGEYDYALRYGEFIPLCIRKIQTLAARVAELERKIAA